MHVFSKIQYPISKIANRLIRLALLMQMLFVAPVLRMSYAFVHEHVLKFKGSNKAQWGTKYAEHSENEGQEEGQLTCIHIEGREVWMKWHPVS